MRIPIIATVGFSAEDFRPEDLATLGAPAFGRGSQWRIVVPIGWLDMAAPDAVIEAISLIPHGCWLKETLSSPHGEGLAATARSLDIDIDVLGLASEDFIDDIREGRPVLELSRVRVLRGPVPSLARFAAEFAAHSQDELAGWGEDVAQWVDLNPKPLPPLPCACFDPRPWTGGGPTPWRAALDFTAASIEARKIADGTASGRGHARPNAL